MVNEGFSGFAGNKEQQAEIAAERLETVKKSLADYAGLESGARALILTDEISHPETLALFKRALEEAGAEYETVDMRDKEVGREYLEGKLAADKLVIKLSGSQYQSLDGMYDENLVKYRARMLNLLDLDPAVFNPGGAMGENLAEMEQRLNKMEHRLKEAAGFRISSQYGTDLRVGLRPLKERAWHKSTGRVEEGKWDNWPGGEIFTTPDESRVSGVLVLPVLTSDISTGQGVDEYVRVNIKDGVITSIEGGESAGVLREKLMEDMRQEVDGAGNPRNVLRIAEIAFGANTKARSSATDEAAAYGHKSLSITETEKRFGTMHLAFGSSQHGEEEADGFEDAVSHYDFVIPRRALTVEQFNSENDFARLKNGRKLISGGGIDFS